MLKQMKKTIAILLILCFVMSAATVSLALGKSYSKDKGNNWGNETVTTAAIGADQGTSQENIGKSVIENNAKPAIENTVKPAIENNAKPAIENNVKPVIENNAKPVIENNAKPVI
jgi:hypothetical protein